MNIVEELYMITDALNANSIEYALCGGLAVAIYGRPSMAISIELLVPNVDEELVYQVLRQLGRSLR